MANVLQFKRKPKMDAIQAEIADFIESLMTVKELFLMGELENVLIIVECKDGDKLCGANGLTVSQGVDMCRDFIQNTEEYID